VNISVDTGRCQGHTLCAMTAPELFGSDEQDGHATVIPAAGSVPRELEEVARDAVASCPEQAITLAEGKTP
jgi:ferredoxin